MMPGGLNDRAYCVFSFTFTFFLVLILQIGYGNIQSYIIMNPNPKNVERFGSVQVQLAYVSMKILFSSEKLVYLDQTCINPF